MPKCATNDRVRGPGRSQSPGSQDLRPAIRIEASRSNAAAMRTAAHCGIGMSAELSPGTNWAVIVAGPLTVKVQAAVPLQPSPSQPANSWPGAGFGTRVRVDPGATAMVQFDGQPSPAGEDVTVPLPLVTTVMIGANTAPTLCAAAIVTLHVVVPLQAPLHPAKT